METHTIYTQDSTDLFHNPARIIITGYSNSGKSEMCSNLIKKYHDKFNTILYCGVNSHDLQNNPDINEKLHISSEIVNPFDYSYNRNTLFILDDCFLEAIESKFVVNAFTKGRHESISTIFITQNLFFSSKFARIIALNCSHYILMSNRDLGQIEVLDRQLYGKSKVSNFVDVYKKALTVNTYGYLLIDLGLKTPPELQLCTNIIDETPYQIVYQW